MLRIARDWTRKYRESEEGKESDDETRKHGDRRCRLTLVLSHFYTVMKVAVVH